MWRGRDDCTARTSGRVTTGEAWATTCEAGNLHSLSLRHVEHATPMPPLFEAAPTRLHHLSSIPSKSHACAGHTSATLSHLSSKESVHRRAWDPPPVFLTIQRRSRQSEESMPWPLSCANASPWGQLVLQVRACALHASIVGTRAVPWRVHREAHHLLKRKGGP